MFKVLPPAEDSMRQDLYRSLFKFMLFITEYVYLILNMF